MTLPADRQLKYWGIAAAVLFLLLWVLGDVILPFILGAAIAYLFDPVADAQQRVGFSRVKATVTITVGSILVFVVVGLLVIPTLVQQAAGLVDTAPQLFQRLQAYLTERFPDLLDTESTLRKSIVSLGETIQSKGGQLLNTVFASFAGLVNIAVLFVLVPVVTFYLLLDWDRLIAEFDALLPRDHAPTIRRLARDIDRTLASFIRGQGTVCLILGTYYAAALMVVGLQFGLVVGFVAGLLTFIPYVGALVGGVMAIGLALFQFWGEWLWILLVAAIFQLGQMIEGNILTPKLVGSSVGLHPVTLIFALSAFGALFGFVGLLVAVPVAAALGVLVRFAVEQYKNSRLYRGIDDDGV